jgi:hypothetical protein
LYVCGLIGNSLESTQPISGIFERWSNAFASAVYRRQVLVYLLIFIAILIAFPHFFAFIESRQGWQIADPLLRLIPANDLSLITFSIIWIMSLFLLVRMIQLPSLALLAIVAIDLIFLTRMVTIILFPLEPPPGLIALEDPISNFFYGKAHGFITRDLFFSGHTSSMIMIGLLLPGKWEKRLAFTAALAVGCLVLVQHIHYTIDVLGAWVFTWFLYRLAKAMVVIPQNASPS